MFVQPLLLTVLFLWKQRNQSELLIEQGRTDRIIKDGLLSACPVVLTGELLTPFPQELRIALSRRKYGMLWCSCFSPSGLQVKQWPIVAYTSYNSARTTQNQRQAVKLRGDCENKVSKQRQENKITTSESKRSCKLHMARTHECVSYHLVTQSREGSYKHQKHITASI